MLFDNLTVNYIRKGQFENDPINNNYIIIAVQKRLEQCCLWIYPTNIHYDNII